MQINPIDIFCEYSDAVSFKNSLGSKGMYEQNRINERFYSGDQWYGAKCGNDRPLVRHNIIKRIGDFKMAQVLSSPIVVKYSADGVPCFENGSKGIAKTKKKLLKEPDFRFSGTPDTEEINTVMSALSSYQRITAERVGFDALCANALKNSYINGSAVVHTYWDSAVNTGLYTSGNARIKGDIACEVLSIENVHFADPYEPILQNQPYIILSSRQDAEAVRREALLYGVPYNEASEIKADSDDGKVLVLTKLYKEYKRDGGYKIKCVKVTENFTVRPCFDTRLRMYPLAIFRFEEKNRLAYGESEITNLIPNQIAINRMITANVWAAMSSGMPMMVVNGDTVTSDITNDPGQIIKVYGSNEDVAGAVKYVAPPDASAYFTDNVKSLIDNTLTQSGANAAALGDSDPNNASAIMALRNAALLPLNLIKNRFYNFIEQISRIWADFWITQYDDRYIRIEDENGVWYMPFEAGRYSQLQLTARVDVGADNQYSVNETVNVLGDLYDKGIINKKQYLQRLPQGIVSDVRTLLQEINEQEEIENDGT